MRTPNLGGSRAVGLEYTECYVQPPPLELSPDRDYTTPLSRWFEWKGLQDLG